MRDSERLATWGVLGAAMLDEGLMLTALGKLRRDAMVGREAWVLEGLRSISVLGEAPGLVLLAKQLERSGKLEAVGGASALARLLEFSTIAENFDSAIRIVNDAAVARAVKRAAEDSIDAAGAGNGWEALDALEAKLVSIREDAPGAEIRTVGEVLLEMREGRRAGIRTGFGLIDWATSGGLCGGWLSVVGARPGIGKTAMLTSIAGNVLRSGRRVAFFSLEMPAEEIVERFAAQQGPTLTEVKRGGSAVDEARERIENLPLTVIPPGEPSMLSIRARLRRMKPKPDFVIVDYLQLVNPCERCRNRWEIVDQATKELKRDIAREFDVPVLAAAQLNRAIEREHRARAPRLSDLRESGGIENHSDVITLLHRPKGGTPELEVAKNRHGQDQVGCKLRFVGERAAYFDVDSEASSSEHQVAQAPDERSEQEFGF